MKKTKIIATVGPASMDETVLEKLIYEGVNVFRLNFSHGDHETHEKSLKLIRKVSKRLSIPVGILQDLAGPKIRIGDFATDTITLKRGQKFTLSTKACVGDESKAFVSYRNLPKEVKKGSRILLDDGQRTLEVVRVSGTEIFCKVLVGGTIKGRRGVNVPGANLSISALTEKDKRDLEFGIEHNVDFIGLSFVRTVENVQGLRSIMDARKTHAMLISKVETAEAVENIDEIIEASDGILIARGDLAVEIPREDVPIVQKDIVVRCNQAGKPVVIATQMLESMIEAPVPTRAEVSDVANAVYEGASAVMLSGETAIGKHPVSTVKIMKKVAKKAEPYFKSDVTPSEYRRSGDCETYAIVDSITHSLVSSAKDLNVKVIVALTESGFTARMISRHHPQQPILVMTPNEKVVRKSMICFGCYPYKIKSFKYVGQVVDEVRERVLKLKMAKVGDKIAIAAGVPFGIQGGSNMLMIIEV